MNANGMPGCFLPDAMLHNLTPACLFELLFSAHATGNAAAVIQISALLMCRMSSAAGWPWAQPTFQQPNTSEPRTANHGRRRAGGC